MLAGCYVWLRGLHKQAAKSSLLQASVFQDAIRHYLHYHIKAAKTNLHMRMRRKVRGWLQVLNRAALASEAPREKKTISGRTFTRK